ncbi:hypothetical protein P8S53_01985 [Roseinatronobacter sp. S2]|nr:hypothetical protein [Roseinatronobacter sp. S2]WFE75200.1 hypothetical protein P8S53_01985 [Roseinatronobacter sp. S2]
MNEHTGKCALGFVENIWHDNCDRQQHDHQVEPEWQMEHPPQAGADKPAIAGGQSSLKVSAPKDFFAHDVEEEHGQPHKQQQALNALKR